MLKYTGRHNRNKLRHWVPPSELVLRPDDSRAKAPTIRTLDSNELDRTRGRYFLSI